MFAVQGIYANGTVTISEPVPVNKKYDVVVTFLRPAGQAQEKTTREAKIAALDRITGILSDSVMTLEEAKKTLPHLI